MALSGTCRLGPLFARLPVGAIFAYHGYEKLFGGKWDEFYQGVKSFGFPSWFDPNIMAHVAAWGEFVGGICLIIGLLTRLAALVNAGTMVVGIWKVHLGGDLSLDSIKSHFSTMDGHGYEFPLALLGICLCLFFVGAGALSLDSLFRRERPPMVVTTMPAMK